MDLYAFLHPIELKEESEIVISKRFRDENGNVVPFKIKAISQEENDLITKKSRRVEKTNGFVQEIFDPVEYNKRLIVAATVFPDFANAQLCERYGTLDALEVPGRMLKAGEYTALLSAITELSGFNNSAEEKDEKIKN